MVNLFSVGQAFNTVVPDVYVVEDMGLPSIDTNVGSQIIGIVGNGLWGGETIYQSTSQVDLVRLLGGTGSDLGKMIDASRTEGRVNIAALRVLGSGAVAAKYELAAGAATTWDFEWEFAGAKGNDTLLQVVEGDITDTVTLIFKLDGDFIRVRNVDNDPYSENYIGTKFNVAGMTFTKTGTATTLPSVTATDAEFTTGADGSDAADADLLLAAQEMLSQVPVTHFMFAQRSNAALLAGIALLAGEYPNVIFFQTPIEDELVDEFDACVEEALEFADNNVVTCMGNVSYFNPEDNAFENLEQIGFVTQAAKYSYAGSPIGKNTRFRWVESWNRADRERMSEVHLAYAHNDGQGWYINDLRTGVRDDYRSSVMIRSTFNVVEKLVASSLRSAIGMTGSVEDRKARTRSLLTSLGEFFVSRSIIDNYRVDVDGINSQSVSRGELLADLYIQKYPETRAVVIHVKRMDTGVIAFEEEVR
jgi:hypothetical protein